MPWFVMYDKHLLCRTMAKINFVLTFYSGMTFQIYIYIYASCWRGQRGYIILPILGIMKEIEGAFCSAI